MSWGFLLSSSAFIPVPTTWLYFWVSGRWEIQEEQMSRKSMGWSLVECGVSVPATQHEDHNGRDTGNPPIASGKRVKLGLVKVGERLDRGVVNVRHISRLFEQVESEWSVSEQIEFQEDSKDRSKIRCPSKAPNVLGSDPRSPALLCLLLPIQVPPTHTHVEKRIVILIHSFKILREIRPFRRVSRVWNDLVNDTGRRSSGVVGPGEELGSVGVGARFVKFRNPVF